MPFKWENLLASLLPHGIFLVEWACRRRSDCVQLIHVTVVRMRTDADERMNVIRPISMHI